MQTGTLTGFTEVSAGIVHSLAVNGTGTTTYTYDQLYRLTGVTAPSGTTSYSYDPVGNVAAMQILANAAGLMTTSYSYDQLNRLTAMQTVCGSNAPGEEPLLKRARRGSFKPSSQTISAPRNAPKMSISKKMASFVA